MLRLQALPPPAENIITIVSLAWMHWLPKPRRHDQVIRCFRDHANAFPTATRLAVWVLGSPLFLLPSPLYQNLAQRWLLPDRLKAPVRHASGSIDFSTNFYYLPAVLAPPCFRFSSSGSQEQEDWGAHSQNPKN